MNPAEHIAVHDAPAAPADIDGARAMLSGDAISALDFLVVLRISGVDALAYLQGQLTADVGEVKATTSRTAAWCSPRGRVLTVFRLLAGPPGEYLVVCERWFVEKLLAHMRMFILRKDVRIDDVSDALCVAGAAGTLALPDKAAAWAQTADVDDAAVFEEITIARVPGRHRRFVVVAPPACIASIGSPRAAARVQCASAGAWRLADICAGVARITEDMSDAFVPQMLNLDRLRAVSFEKGCYVGQEIVARAEHLGRIKRRACVGRTAAAARGDPIVDMADGEASKVGIVVAAEPHPDGGSAACVVLNIESAGSSTLHVGRSDGAPIRLSSPDYMESCG